MSKDYTETARRIAQGELVLGSWNDPLDPGDPFMTWIKGRYASDKIIAQGRAHEVQLDVIECDDAAEADMLRQRFGDGLN